ncbi:MAG: DUF6666 family protein [Pirellulales bacterium]
MGRPLTYSLRIATLAATLLATCLGSVGRAQSFRYEAKPRAELASGGFLSDDPAPRMMEPAEEIGRPLVHRRYVDPRYAGRGPEITELAARRWASRQPASRVRTQPSRAEAIAPSATSDPFIELGPADGPIMAPPGDPGTMGSGPEGAMYPPQADGGPWVDDAHPGALPGEGPYVDGPQGGRYVDEYSAEGPWMEAQGGDCGGCGQCAECRSPYRLSECIHDWWHAPTDVGALGRNISAIGAAQGFKSPVDMGQNGNFGVYYGANWGFPLLSASGVSGQFGAIVSFADFQGGTGLINKARTQWFVTGGLFHRAMCDQGFQCGAVLDYLNDEFYVTMNLLQVRAELAYLWNKWELGVWAAAHTKSDTQVAPVSFGVPTVTWQANDQFNLYYRYHYNYNTVARAWIGADSLGGLLFGGDATAPLSERWGIQIAYNYIIPRDEAGVSNAVKETWGLTIGTVWYPWCKTPNCKFDPHRPLFTVGDNSTFFVRTK